MTMQSNLLATLTRAQLRTVVAQVITISETKLNKMSKEKCIIKVKHLNYNQLTKLLNS